MQNKSKLISLLSATALSMIASISIHAQSVSSNNNSSIISAYWTDWSEYPTSEPRQYPMSGSLDNNGNKLDNPDLDLQLKKLNLLYFAFLETDATGSIMFHDNWGDLSVKDAGFCTSNSHICGGQVPNSGLGNFDGFSQLKSSQHYTGKLLISMGGWQHDDSFQNAFNNPTVFVNSVAALIKQYNLDGIDLDFEPWDQGGTGWTPAYVSGFINLAQQLRAALPNTIITVASSADPLKIQAFDNPSAAPVSPHNWQILAKSVNYIDIMGYDFQGEFSSPKITDLASNLYVVPHDPFSDPISDKGAITTLLNDNVSSAQIVLGVPAYGDTVSGVQNSNNGLLQPFTGVGPGDLQPGQESYYNIVSQWLTTGGYSEYTLDNNNSPSGVWAYNSTAQNFVSFDDTGLIDAKAQYVLNNKLAGMMMWELKDDLSINDPNNASLLNHITTGLQNTSTIK